MKKVKRTWSIEEKEFMLKEIEKLGVTEGCRKFGIYQTTYYDWQKKYQQGGIEALKPQYIQRSEKEVRHLEKENGRLKKLLAEKELEIMLKDELIKKKMLPWKNVKK